MTPALPANQALAHAVVQVADRGTIYAVIAGFLLTLVGVGLVFRRFSRDASDYFRAGGKATWWLTGGSIYMGSFSAWTFTGAASAAYDAGWSVVAMYGANVAAFLTLALAPAAWFRQTRMVTVGDVIRARFGVGMEQFYSYLQSLLGPMAGGVHLYTLAVFTSILLGFKIHTIIIVLGVVVLFYTALSGAWAVLATDFIKGLILLPITVVTAVVCLKQFGGIGGFLARITEAGLHDAFLPVKTPESLATMPNIAPGYFTWGFFAAYYGFIIFNALALSNAGKYLTVKDGREARRAALLAGAATLVGMFIFFIPPMSARLLIPLEVAALPMSHPSEGAYAAIAMHLLPTGLVALVLVAMCASTMSTLDSNLTGLAGLITQNIYPALCRIFRLDPCEGRARLILGRFVNLGCALLLISCALFLASVSTVGIFRLMFGLALVTTPLVVPLMWGLFVRRVPSWAAPISVIVGGLVSAGIAFVPMIRGAPPWPYHQQMLSILAAGTLAFFLSRLFYGPGDTAAVSRETEFFSHRDRPVDFAAEIGAGNDHRQARIIGVFGLLLGVGILLLLLPASSAGRSAEVIAVAVSTAGFGTLLLYAGWISRERTN